MIDARSLLDQLIRGNQGAQSSPAGARNEDLGSLLQQIFGAQGSGGAQGASPDQSLPPGSQASTGGPRGADQPSQGGGLADILGQFTGQAGSGGAGLSQILGQVFSQATGGAKDGAQRLGEATGATDSLRDMIGQLSGRPPEQIIAQLKDIIAKNPAATSAALGGLGAVLLGSRTGRSVAGGAARLGALALIGGLAYRAYQAYAQSQSPGTSGQHTMALSGAPAGTGFEEAAVTDDTAMACLRAMIAAAASDGRIDANEQSRLVQGLEGSGFDEQHRAFLVRELNRPATPDELAALVRTPEEAVQVYTAARLAVDVDTREESAFLQRLADKLGVDPALAAHIDSMASNGASARS